MQLCAAFLAATDRWTQPRRVLNISSGLGRYAMASQAGYCAAKAGMDHFTRCMALDEALKPHGAKVCSLAPGVIDTDMQVQLRAADPARFPNRERFVKRRQRLPHRVLPVRPARLRQHGHARRLARPHLGGSPRGRFVQRRNGRLRNSGVLA